MKMDKAIVYIHGKGGNAAEADHYKPLFSECEVIGFSYKSETPWAAAEEFPRFFGEQNSRFRSVSIIANSIGAYFAASSLSPALIEEAWFISPIVDMERLIYDMLAIIGKTADDLKKENEITTPFGEVLSYKYLCYAAAHPIRWQTKTHILYGRHDNMTSIETISGFASGIGASLTVMENGEHWFHTPEQMAFLDSWITENK